MAVDALDVWRAARIARMLAWVVHARVVLHPVRIQFFGFGLDIGSSDVAIVAFQAVALFELMTQQASWLASIMWLVAILADIVGNRRRPVVGVRPGISAITVPRRIAQGMAARIPAAALVACGA